MLWHCAFITLIHYIHIKRRLETLFLVTRWIICILRYEDQFRNYFYILNVCPGCMLAGTLSLTHAIYVEYFNFFGFIYFRVFLYFSCLVFSAIDELINQGSKFEYVPRSDMIFLTINALRALHLFITESCRKISCINKLIMLLND